MKQTRKSKPNPFDAGPWKESICDFRPRQAFDAANVTEAKHWQSRLRPRFRQLLGVQRGSMVFRRALPLQSQVLERVEFEDYTREAVRFQSRANLPVFGYFLLPKEVPHALPALLCLHGHGYGVDALVGLDEHGKPRAQPDYHHDFALQAVRRGYVVLAIEILGFGRRREGHFEPGSRDSSCQTLAGTALMLGQTMAGWRVHDALRAIDYMQSRREVASARIGAIGISGGGLNTLYLAALDHRVRAAVVSGFLNTFRDSIMAVPHCIDNFVPGLLEVAEMSDIAGLVAPRALWFENGTRDNIFPVAAFHHALDEVKYIYDVLGVPDHCGGTEFDGEHQFDGTGAWEFLKKHLQLNVQPGG